MGRGRARRGLPENCKKIIVSLDRVDYMSQKELVQVLHIPHRTVRYALERLMQDSIVQQHPNLMDMRSIYYRLNHSDPEASKIIKKTLDEQRNADAEVSEE